MTHTQRAKRVLAIVVLGGCLLAGTGCDQHVAGQLTTLSGGFLGNIVNVVTTHYLQTALGIEATEGDAADGHEHAHDSSALHDHEH